MTKYSVFAIILAIAVGVVGGSFFTSHKAEKELQKERDVMKKKIEHDNDSIRQLVLSRDRKILQLEDSHKIDSVKINGMLLKIAKDEAATKQRRKEAQKLSPHEKVSFLLNRYTPKP